MCLCMRGGREKMSMCNMYDSQKRPEKSIKSPGPENIGRCELPNMAVGNKTQVLWKVNKHS